MMRRGACTTQACASHDCGDFVLWEGQEIGCRELCAACCAIAADCQHTWGTGHLGGRDRRMRATGSYQLADKQAGQQQFTALHVIPLLIRVLLIGTQVSCWWRYLRLVLPSALLLGVWASASAWGLRPELHCPALPPWLLPPLPLRRPLCDA
jgi:hypothetical protein